MLLLLSLRVLDLDLFSQQDIHGSTSLNDEISFVAFGQHFNVFSAPPLVLDEKSHVVTHSAGEIWSAISETETYKTENDGHTMGVPAIFRRETQKLLLRLKSSNIQPLPISEHSVDSFSALEFPLIRPIRSKLWIFSQISAPSNQSC
jgi:hypothetical protein